MHTIEKDLHVFDGIYGNTRHAYVSRHTRMV
jgi:hypothetical protein